MVNGKMASTGNGWNGILQNVINKTWFYYVYFLDIEI